MNPKDNDELLSELRWITSNQLEESEYKAILDLISTHVIRAREAEIELMLSEGWDYELELMLRRRLAHLNSQRKENNQ